MPTVVLVKNEAREPSSGRFGTAGHIIARAAAADVLVLNRGGSGPQHLADRRPRNGGQKGAGEGSTQNGREPKGGTRRLGSRSISQVTNGRQRPLASSSISVSAVSPAGPPYMTSSTSPVHRHQASCARPGDLGAELRYSKPSTISTTKEHPVAG